MEDSFVPYPIDYLVKRIYTEMKDSDTLNLKKKLRIPVKFAVRIKNKKTFITSFRDLCDALKRDPNTVAEFISHELSTKSSITEENELKLSGMFMEKRVTELVITYILKYVQCSSCTESNTEIVTVLGTKQLSCNKCKALTLIN